MSDDVTNLAEVLRAAHELAYVNMHADWAVESIANHVLASDWLAERDATNRLAGAAMANSDAIAAYAELVERVEALASRLNAAPQIAADLRALIDPEATS